MLTEITDQTFKDSVAAGVNLVLFYKDQCPFCNAMKKIIAKFAQRPGVTDRDLGYFQINRETNPEITNRLEIDRIPVVMVFRDGEKIHSKSGDVTYRDLDQMTS